MSQLLERSPRVDYQTPVRLLSSESEQFTWGQTINLSESGMLVRVPDPYPVGTELKCAIILPNEQWELHGRVAWIQDTCNQNDDTSGMGIQFFGLDEPDTKFLQQTVISFGYQFTKPWSQYQTHSTSGDFDASRKKTTKETTQFEISFDPLEISPQESALPLSQPRTSSEKNETAGSFFAQIKASPSLTFEPLVELSKTDEWTMGVLPPQEEFEQKSFLDTRVLSPIENHRHLYIWRWIAATLVTIGLGSLVYSDLWDQVVERSKRWAIWASIQDQDNTPDFDPLVKAVSNPVPTITPKKEKTSQSISKLEKIAAVSPQIITKQESFLKIIIKEKTKKLYIPISGSFRDAYKYSLANPEGLAVNLPHANPLIPFGDYWVKREGFGIVWIHKREKGTHIRVIFTEDAPEQKKLTFLKNQILVTLGEDT